MNDLYRFVKEINFWIHILRLQSYSKVKCGTFAGPAGRALAKAIGVLGRMLRCCRVPNWVRLWTSRDFASEIYNLKRTKKKTPVSGVWGPNSAVLPAGWFCIPTMSRPATGRSKSSGSKQARSQEPGNRQFGSWKIHFYQFIIYKLPQSKQFTVGFVIRSGLCWTKLEAEELQMILPICRAQHLTCDVMWLIIRRHVIIFILVSLFRGSKLCQCNLWSRRCAGVVLANSSIRVALNRFHQWASFCLKVSCHLPDAKYRIPDPPKATVRSLVLPPAALTFHVYKKCWQKITCVKILFVCELYVSMLCAWVCDLFVHRAFSTFRVLLVSVFRGAPIS